MADITRDGAVATADLLTVLEDWGACSEGGAQLTADPTQRAEELIRTRLLDAAYSAATWQAECGHSQHVQACRSRNTKEHVVVVNLAKRVHKPPPVEFLPAGNTTAVE